MNESDDQMSEEEFSESLKDMESITDVQWEAIERAVEKALLARTPRSFSELVSALEFILQHRNVNPLLLVSVIAWKEPERWIPTAEDVEYQWDEVTLRMVTRLRLLYGFWLRNLIAVASGPEDWESILVIPITTQNADETFSPKVEITIVRHDEEQFQLTTSPVGMIRLAKVLIDRFNRLPHEHNRTVSTDDLNALRTTVDSFAPTDEGSD